MNRLRSRNEIEASSSSQASGIVQRWTNESCVTFQAWKNNCDKYVICVIRVAKRGKYYYSGQTEPHFTFHWLQPEHWAAFESKLKELTAHNHTLKYLTRTLRYKLIDSIQLSISRTTIPIDLLCETISDARTVRKKDVIAAIECKFEYLEEDKSPEEFSPFKGLQSNEKDNEENVSKTSGKKNLPKYRETEIKIQKCSEELSPFKEDQSNEKDNEEKVSEKLGEKNLPNYRETEIKMEECSEELSPFKGLQSNGKAKKEHDGKTLGKKNLQTNLEEEKKLTTPRKEESGKHVTKRQLRRSDDAVHPQKTDHKIVDPIIPPKKSPSNKLLSVPIDGENSQDFVTPEKLQLRNGSESSQKKRINARKQQDQKKVILKLDVSDNEFDDPLDILASKPLQNKTSISAKDIQKRHKRDQSDSTSEREESNQPGKKRTKYSEIITTTSDCSEGSSDENNSSKALSVLNGNLKKSKKSSPPNREKSLENSATKKNEPSPMPNKPKATKFPFPKSIFASPAATTNSKKNQKKKVDMKSPPVQECQSMNKWLSKKKDEKPKEMTNQDEVLNCIVSDSDLETIPNSDSLNSSQENEEIQMKKIAETRKFNREVSKFLQEIVPKTPKKIKNLDLMALETREILDTFDLYEPQLQSLFDEFKWKSKPKHKNGVDHYLVMSLLSPATQLGMMNALSERYEKHRVGLPKYGELFSMVLMPEWILSIFMKRYGMTRQQAIDHIKAQNAYKMHLQSEVQIDESIEM